MNTTEEKKALAIAVKAAQSAGAVMRRNLYSAKKVAAVTTHDVKLKLDVECQLLIERKLHAAFPKISVLGEEGDSGDTEAALRWVVDPIDGTVNFAHGIPHACVSIALQQKIDRQAKSRGRVKAPENYETLAGVVDDPFCGELWTAIRGQPARLNGGIIQASRRTRLAEAVVSIGFAKSRGHLKRSLPGFIRVARRAQKVRMMGSAALGLAYVACGRFDAYIESGIRLWDIAAGGLILECAGGEFWRRPIPGPHAYRMVASNGRLRRQLSQFYNE